MESVGIREMKAHLSQLVRRVKAGETVAVTERGKIVALLQPPPSAPQPPQAYPSIEERVLAAGGRPATQRGPIGELPSSAAEFAGMDVQTVLDDLRGDR